MKQRKIIISIMGAGPITARHAGFIVGLLENVPDNSISIEAISGSSGGALTAIALSDGLANGSIQDACDRVKHLWLGQNPLEIITKAMGLKGGMLGVFKAANAAQIVRTIVSSQPSKNLLLRNIVGKFFEKCLKAHNKKTAPLTLINAADPHNNSVVFSNRDADGICENKISAAICVPELFGAIHVNGYGELHDGAYINNSFPLELCARYLSEGGEAREIIVLGGGADIFISPSSDSKSVLQKLFESCLRIYNDERLQIKKLGFVIHEPTPFEEREFNFRTMFNYTSVQFEGMFQEGYKKGKKYAETLCIRHLNYENRLAS